MAKYEIYKVDPQVTSTGKKVKRLTVQKEGAQYPTKNVALWEDHPLYNSIAPGQTLELQLSETDSGTPNPNAPGKNYINRSVINTERTQSTGSAQQTPQNQNITEMAIKTHMDRHFAALRADLKIIADHLGVEPPQAPKNESRPDYPEDPDIEDRIDDDDIPF